MSTYRILRAFARNTQFAGRGLSLLVGIHRAYELLG